MRRWAAAFGAVIVALAAGAGLTLLFGWGILVVALESLLVSIPPAAPYGWVVPYFQAAVLLGGAAFAAAWIGRWLGDRAHRWWGGVPRVRESGTLPLGRRIAAGLASYGAGVLAGLGGGALLILAVRAAGAGDPAVAWTVSLIILSAPTLGIIVTRAVAARFSRGGPPPAHAAAPAPASCLGTEEERDGGPLPCGAA